MKPINRTAYIDQKNLRDPKAVFVSSYENSSLTLTCEVESNPLNDNVIWFYYELSNEGLVRNQVMLSSRISTLSRVINETKRLFYSQLTLANLTSNHSGYYACSLNAVLKDSLNHTHALNANATYFLLVQCIYLFKKSQ